MRLREFVREQGNKADKISMDKLLINIGHIIDYLDKHYSNYPFDLLVGKSMDEIAELGYFIIRYIERFGLDSAVGTDKNKPNRQIKFVPDNKDDYGPNRGQVDRYEGNARQRLAKIEKSIISDYVLRKKRKQL